MKNIKDKIEDELIDLDLPLQGDAFMYWRELLIYIKNKNIQMFTMLDLYKKIGKHFKKSDSSVERILRTGTDKMKKRIKEKYGINTKITNETVVRLFQIKIF